MKPYYQDAQATIYHGDCRDVLPGLALPEDGGWSMVTDPTWPNASVPLFGHEDPEGMMAAMLDTCPGLPTRLAVQLGCDSDPRFLRLVPAELPFFRVAWLEVVRMGYRGRLGHTGDVGYLFGQPPKSRPGARIIPGRCIDADSSGKQSEHPCPRKLAHVQWLVRWWTEPVGDLVVDPFMGSGTTLLAAAKLQRHSIGIEIEEEYCEMAARRLQEANLDLFVAAEAS